MNDYPNYNWINLLNSYIDCHRNNCIKSVSNNIKFLLLKREAEGNPKIIAEKTVTKIFVHSLYHNCPLINQKGIQKAGIEPDTGATCQWDCFTAGTRPPPPPYRTSGLKNRQVFACMIALTQYSTVLQGAGRGGGELFSSLNLSLCYM